MYFIISFLEKMSPRVADNNARMLFAHSDIL